MDDLIRRQAAIDALEKHEKSKGHNYSMFADVVSECAEIIRDVPSAQPSQKNDSNTLEALDCVSRKAAIEFRVSHGLNEDGRLYVPFDEVRKYLEQLSSAQPEVTEEAVKEYCHKRCLTVLTNDYFHQLLSVQPDENMIHLQKEQAYMAGWEDGREALRKELLDER